MASWVRLRCACGARWQWYGRQSEAAVLERLWRNSHLGGGHAIEVMQTWGRAA